MKLKYLPGASGLILIAPGYVVLQLRISAGVQNMRNTCCMNVLMFAKPVQMNVKNILIWNIVKNVLKHAGLVQNFVIQEWLHNSF
jgi:hypothetical protein